MMGRYLRFTLAMALAALLCPSMTLSQSRGQSIGPFEIVSADSTSRLRLQFAGQQLVTWQKVEDDDADLTAELRRIRLGLRGSFNRNITSFYLQLSFAARSLELMDFYLDHRLGQGNLIRVGQYKVPFTRFRIQSFQRLTFADWPIVTKAFGAERQIGVAIHNGYEAPPRWGYVVGLFTGVNARASHGIGIPTAYGAEIANPSDLANPGPKSDVHPEAFLHLSYHTRGMRVDSDSDPERGPARVLVALSGAWDFDPTAHQDFAQRAALELLTKWQGWSASAIGYMGYSKMRRYPYPSPDRENKLAMLGALAQTAYRIDESWEMAARYAIFDDTNDLQGDAIYSVSQTGLIIKQQEATIGINYYIDEHAFKWQNDASWIRTDDGGHQIQYRIRSQLQLAF